MFFFRFYQTCKNKLSFYHSLGDLFGGLIIQWGLYNAPLVVEKGIRVFNVPLNISFSYDYSIVLTHVGTAPAFCCILNQEKDNARIGALTKNNEVGDTGWSFRWITIGY